MKEKLLLLCGIVVFQLSVQAQNTDIWNKYVAGTTDKLLDYSYAGYHQSEQALPTVTSTSHTVFNITNYGAIANDGVSDRQAILDAVAAAEAHGGPAQVFFPPGRFLINELSDLGKPVITVSGNNVVLKGSGIEQTELYADQPVLNYESSVIVFEGKWPGSVYWRGVDKTDITNNPAPGGYTVNVASTAGLYVGQIVNIDADLNPATSAGKAYFSPHSVPGGVHKTQDYLLEMHEIKLINGNTVTFTEPIHIDLEHMENLMFRVVEPSYFVMESGIEDMTLIGNYREQYKHHRGSRHGENFRMLGMYRTMNCWARNLRIVNPCRGIYVTMSKDNTFMNINMEGNVGHNPISVNYSYGCLFAYCKEIHEGHHGFGGHGTAASSVFLRCNQYDGLEAHCGWIRASLYDMNKGGFEPRGGGASYTPMHSKGLCFWNWNVTKSGSYDFWPTGKYGYFLNPVIVGLHGQSFTVADQSTDLLLMESNGTKVNPESLFEAQLAHRLGSLPAWLATETQLFEDVSRHSEISISSPDEHTTHAANSSLDVGMAIPSQMNTSKVARTELWVSQLSLHNGFEKVATSNGWSSQLSFIPDNQGAHVLKVRMINTRGEVCESLPRIVFVGNDGGLKKYSITKASIIPHDDFGALYEDFEDVGGGEALWIPNSTILDPFEAGTKEFHEIEVAYYNELQTAYSTFGQSSVKPLLEKSANVSAANTLIDDNTSTTCPNIYGYLGSTIQFDLGSSKSVSRIDLRWTSVPGDVKVEIQTSNDANAWYSVVNDEPLWDWGISTIGSTLQRKPLPGKTTSTLYLPTRNCRYVRIVVQNFPNNKLSEVKIYGGVEELTSQKEYRVASGVIPGAFQISPNPFTHELTIDIDKNSIKQVLLSDLTGRILYEERIDSNAQTIKLTPSYDVAPAGLYILRLVGENEIKTYKLLRK